MLRLSEYIPLMVFGTTVACACFQNSASLLEFASEKQGDFSYSAEYLSRVQLPPTKKRDISIKVIGKIGSTIDILSVGWVAILG